jgi:hypothetical protein
VSTGDRIKRKSQMEHQQKKKKKERKKNLKEIPSSILK